MGWLWSARGKPRSRPRVARAIVEASEAHTGATPNLGGATALMERAVWSHDLPAITPPPRGGWDSGAGETGAMAASRIAGPSATARRRDFGDVGLLLERAENTARKLGRSRAEMWEEALGAWLETQLAGALDVTRADEVDVTLDVEARPAPRPWLFEARRQRVWGEIEETLGALRTA